MAKKTKKKSAPKRARMSRVARKNQVLENLWECNRVGGCTRRDLVELTGLAYGPHLFSIIADLVAEGWLDVHVNVDRPSDGYRYFPSAKLEQWHKEHDAERVSA